MSGIKQKIIDTFANELYTHGKKILEDCYNLRDFENQTYNLHDSYGMSIYYQGNEIEKYRYIFDEQAAEGKKWQGGILYGNTEIAKFLGNYKPNDNGLCLVIAVAMPYAQILESGKGLTRKYQVISSSLGKLESLKRELNLTKARVEWIG